MPREAWGGGDGCLGGSWNSRVLALSPVWAAAWPLRGWLGLLLKDQQGLKKPCSAPLRLGLPPEGEEEGEQGDGDHRGLTASHPPLSGVPTRPLPNPSLTGWLWAPTSQKNVQVPEARGRGRSVPKAPPPHHLFHSLPKLQSKGWLGQGRLRVPR